MIAGILRRTAFVALVGVVEGNRFDVCAHFLVCNGILTPWSPPQVLASTYPRLLYSKTHAEIQMIEIFVLQIAVQNFVTRFSFER